jgi:hypothetical protein
LRLMKGRWLNFLNPWREDTPRSHSNHDCRKAAQDKALDFV